MLQPSNTVLCSTLPWERSHRPIVCGPCYQLQLLQCPAADEISAALCGSFAPLRLAALCDSIAASGYRVCPGLRQCHLADSPSFISSSPCPVPLSPYVFPMPYSLPSPLPSFVVLSSPLPVPVTATPGLLDELEQLVTGIALLRELTPSATDYLVSFGERCSTRIFAALLNKMGLRAVQVGGGGGREKGGGRVQDSKSNGEWGGCSSCSTQCVHQSTEESTEGEPKTVAGLLWAPVGRCPPCSLAHSSLLLLRADRSPCLPLCLTHAVHAADP